MWGHGGQRGYPVNAKAREPPGARGPRRDVCARTRAALWQGKVRGRRFSRRAMRSARGGSTVWGLVHNAVGGVISKNWGFDVREVATGKVMVSYNEGDPKCPPAHAEWLIKHFRERGSTVAVNVGANPSGKVKSSQHGVLVPQVINGEFLTAFAAM